MWCRSSVLGMRANRSFGLEIRTSSLASCLSLNFAEEKLEFNDRAVVMGDFRVRKEDRR
jgi:hypothetical protein